MTAGTAAGLSLVIERCHARLSLPLGPGIAARECREHLRFFQLLEPPAPKDRHPRSPRRAKCWVGCAGKKHERRAARCRRQMHGPRVVADRECGVARKDDDLGEAGLAGQIARTWGARRDRPAEWTVGLGAEDHGYDTGALQCASKFGIALKRPALRRPMRRGARHEE